MASIEYKKLENLFCMFPRGAYTLKSIEENVREVEKIESEIGHPVDRFIDFTGITSVDLSSDELMILSSRRKKVFPEHYSGVLVKLAILAHNDLTFGMSRMYQNYLESGTVSVAVFSSLDKAAEWLGVEISLLKHP